MEMIRDAGRQLVDVLEKSEDTAQWTVPVTLSNALTVIVNEYDRIMHQVPLQAVLAATGKLERLEEEDPQYFRCRRGNDGAMS